MKALFYFLFTLGLILRVLSTAAASNNKPDKVGTKTKSTVVFGLMYLVVSVLVVVSNFIVVVVIVKTRVPRVSTLRLIAHMAFWDLLQGLVYLIFVVPSAFLDRFVFSKSMIFWTAFLISFLTGVTVMNTVTIVVDRYLSLKWPFRHRKLSTKRMYAVLIGVCVYILALIRTLLIFLPDAEVIYSSKTAICISTTVFRRVQGAIASTFVVLLSFVIIIAFSAVILRVVYVKKRRINPGQSVVIPVTIISQSLMVVLSSAVFCLSFVPFVLEMVTTVSYGGEPSDFIAKFAIIAFLSNSIWNIVIYAANYRPFRESFLKLFCRSYYRNLKRRQQNKSLANRRTKVFRINIPKQRMVTDSPSRVEVSQF